jgi:hypothetical protein
MKGKRDELRIPMKFEEAVSDFLKVKPIKKKPKTKKPSKSASR